MQEQRKMLSLQGETKHSLDCAVYRRLLRGERNSCAISQTMPILKQSYNEIFHIFYNLSIFYELGIQNILNFALVYNLVKICIEINSIHIQKALIPSCHVLTSFYALFLY